MTVFNVSFSLLGTAALLDRVDKISKFSSEFSAPLDIIAEKMLQFHIERFKAQQTPDGGNWTQSNSARIAGRATLQDTGQLLRSMRVFGRTENERKVGIPSSDKRNFEIGSKHNTFGDGTRRNVIRKFIGFNNTEHDQIDSILEARLKKIF